MNYSRHIKIAFIVVFALAVGSAYYHHATSKVPQKVLEAQQTIIDVDAIRFTFKTSIMAQKGLIAYHDAIEHSKQPEIDIQIAQDYFYAALSFATPELVNNVEFATSSRDKINQILSIIDKNTLPHSEDTSEQIKSLVNQIAKLAENQERLAWSKIQKDYIDFNTHEYTILQLYEALTIVFVIFLIISIYLLLRQQNLIHQNLQQKDDLRQIAYYDSLTQIANRKSIEQSLNERIIEADKQQQIFYIALLDLDNFKNINDLLGHNAGDELLQKTAEKLSLLTQNTASLGRLGGDEFLIIFDSHIDETTVVSILDDIKNDFIHPIQIEDNPFHVAFSIGVSCYPKDISNPAINPRQQLTKFADIAMYEAKRLGKNQYHFYDVVLEERIQKSHQMDMEIHRAINNNEFELFYQPQVDAKTQLVTGAEALIRWRHPERGLVFPSDFIEYVEQGSHTSVFGEWVIREAILQQKEWQEVGIDIPISVNLSVRHILDGFFYERVNQIIEQLDADLSKLFFEITEYELIQATDMALIDLHLLNKAGFRFHLDDFGTGYSSLSYLNELPIEAIKIDKSFIDYVEPGHAKQNLVEAIIHIGDTLEKEIIAEGVETQYQIDFLRDSGCELLQGYFYSKPIEATKFQNFYLKQLKNAIQEAS